MSTSRNKVNIGFLANSVEFGLRYEAPRICFILTTTSYLSNFYFPSNNNNQTLAMNHPYRVNPYIYCGEFELEADIGENIIEIDSRPTAAVRIGSQTGRSRHIAGLGQAKSLWLKTIILNQF